MFFVFGETKQISMSDDHFVVSTSQAYLSIHMPNEDDGDEEYGFVRLWFTPLGAACLQKSYNGRICACIHTLPVWRDVFEQMHRAFA